MARQYLFGEWRDLKKALTPEDIARLCKKAEKLRGPLADYPLDKTLSILGRVRERWMDASYAPRSRVERGLPAVTGFSPEMVRLGLEELCWAFDPALLRRKMDTELPGLGVPGDLSWEPLGLVLHVLAGNVFVGAAGSLVLGLVTRNVNILKMPSSEPTFLPELIRSIIECDPDGVISGAIAAIDYSSEQSDVISELKKRVDGVAVWGGESAVRAYGEGLPARTKLIVFGPKMSLAVITKEGLKERTLAETADSLASEMSLWDQNACTAPQACYVEGLKNAQALVEAMPLALDAVSKKLPPGRVEEHAAVEIQKLRGIFEVAEPRGEGLLRVSRRGLDWTVVLDHDQIFEPSPLHRTLRVIPFNDPGEVIAQTEGLRGYVQTVGLTAGPGEFDGLGRRFVRAGALRVMALGGMAHGEIDDPHDGRYDLTQFVNHCIIRAKASEGFEPVHTMAPGRLSALIDERLRSLIDKAKRAPFYAKRFHKLQVETTADLERVPLLTRVEMDLNMPPKGEGLSTGPWRGGYVTRSGGSTGEPKFSIYDKPDWDNLVENAAGVFRAMGLKESDRVGNFMIAGDLYGSFVSFDHINNHLGLASFAFGGTSTPETFAAAWRKFGLNAVQGIPSHLIPFLREAKRIEPKLTIEKVLYGGSAMTLSDYAWLKTALKVSRVASVIGANDGGHFAFQCENMRGALHHTADDFNYVEIAGEDGRRVPDGEPGLILITSLLKHAFPLIRYAVGDRGRFVPGRCPCGRTARRLEHLGRSDDILNVGMLNIAYKDFADALGKLPVSAIQLAAGSDKKGESVIVRVETEKRSPAAREHIRKTLLKSVKKLARRVNDGTIAELRIELLKPGALPRNARSGKIKSIVDERI